MEYPQYDYAVIGGDMRQVYLVEELAHHQNRVIYYALISTPDESRCSGTSVITSASSLDEVIGSSRCIICPIPFSKNGIHLNQNILDESLSLTSILTLLTSEHSVFAGCIAKDVEDTIREKGVSVFELMEDQSLVLYNTLATAEGAICEAIKLSPVNLHQSRCAVLGYGKCGRTLVQYLKGLSCYVSACTDHPKEKAFASTVADRAVTLNEFGKEAEAFDFVFNTIPAKILTEDILQRMKPSVTIIDIASAPGGVDYAEAKRLRLTAALCPGLPGKYAPSSSAKALKKAIETALLYHEEV